MKGSISKPQSILLFTIVIFIAHTLAEPSADYDEAMKNHFRAWRARYHEARLSPRTNGSNPQSSNVSGFGNETILNERTLTWAGAVQTHPPSGSFNSVTASWIIAQVKLPANVNSKGMWGMGQWVGIDAWRDSICPKTLFQAGVYYYIQTDDSGAVVFQGVQSWYEWLPMNAIFTNYLVAVGDPIKVWVQALSPLTGVVSFSNSATGSQRVFPTSATYPDYRPICGGSVEWIVENADGVGKLANFGNTYMANCFATTTDGSSSNLVGSTLVDLSENGLIFAKASLVSDTILSVLYVPL